MGYSTPRLRDDVKARLLLEESSSSVSAIRKLNTIMEICYSKIDSILNDDLPDKDKRLVQYMSEVRQTVTELRLFYKDFKITPIDENSDIAEKVVYCLREFPVEYITKFEEKWKEYEQLPKPHLSNHGSILL